MSGARAAVIVLLLALGALRLFAVALHDPIAGYANQYDMARTSACLGLWPVTSGAPDAATPGAPIAAYRYGGTRSDACYPSTDVALAWVAIALDRGFANADRSGAFDLRQLGVLKALLLIAMALLIDRTLRAHPAGRLAHAAWFGVILVDPFNTLYLNTLYTEFGALAGIYLAVASLWVMSLEERPRRILIVAFLAGLLALGASRVQHLALAPALALLALLLFRARAWPLRALAIGAACTVVATLALAARTHATQQGVAAANRIDTVFGAVLPASPTPNTLAAKLGLSESCAQLTHVTWYRQRGVDVERACPAIAAVSRLRIVTALLRDPGALAALFTKGIALSSAWRLYYLGELGDASASRMQTRALAVHAGIDDLIAPRGFVFHVWLWLAPLVAGIWALSALVVGAVRRRHAPAPAIVLLATSTTVCVVTLLSAVVGDGYSELARHLHVAQNALLAAWLALAAIVWTLLRTRRRDAPPPRGVLPAVAGVCLLALIAAPYALARLRLAYGVLDAPANDGAKRTPLALSGWVLDPLGIVAVEARLDHGVPQPLTVHTDAQLSRLMPFARGGAVMRFQGVLQDIPASARVLRIVARNSLRIETEIDRRTLDSAPFPVELSR